MGCSLSKKKAMEVFNNLNKTDENKPQNSMTPTTSPKQPASRANRRLSLARVDGRGIADVNDERGLICALESQKLLDILVVPKPASRRWSVGSVTDPDLHQRGSFADKAVSVQGATFSVTDNGIGYTCKKGLKPVSPNQDSFLVMRVEGGISVYGVFDGHGRRGHDVSNFVKDHLPKLIVGHPEFSTDVTKAIREGFAQTQKLLIHLTSTGKLDASASGTTCTIAVHNPTENKLVVAHVGDSRAVIARRNASGKLIAHDLTIDHKPEIPEERRRIESQGGTVIKHPHDVNHRVYVKGQRYPGLAMSRAFGDLLGYQHAGVSCEPTISEYSLNTNSGDATPATPSDVNSEAGSLHSATSGTSNKSRTRFGGSQIVDEFFLLCSDGVWEFLSSQAAVNLAGKFPRQEAMRASEELSRVSWEKWIEEEGGQVVDDITSLVIHF